MAYPATLDNLATVSSGSTITSAGTNSVINATNSIESAVGLNPARAICEGRLTLATGTAITTSDVTGASTVYFTPYFGNRIGLYDGTSVWSVVAMSGDLSLSLASLTNNTNYDVFVYNNSGTPTLEPGPVWMDGTTRAGFLHPWRRGPRVVRAAPGHRPAPIHPPRAARDARAGHAGGPQPGGLRRRRKSSNPSRTDLGGVPTFAHAECSG